MIAHGALYSFHMNPDLEPRIAALEEKIDKIYVSVEKTRKYLLWTMITSVVLFVLPLIGVALVIPQFLNSYVGSINTLSQ
jgi:hypothetical protein